MSEGADWWQMQQQLEQQQYEEFTKGESLPDNSDILQESKNGTNSK